jgi:hypothetical protein
VTVAVPVRFENEDASPGLKKGGVLNVVRHDVELVVDAAEIPDDVVVDLKGFEVGDSIHISAVTLPDSPMPGIVEFDAVAYAAAALDCARQVLAAHGPVEAVGITTQRASVVVWDRATGQPVAPAQGWQDLRTVGDCLVLAAEGIRLAPNQSATKIANILDSVDPERVRDLCVGTVDSWIAWNLTEGAHHVSDLSNAAVWGLLDGTTQGLATKVIDRLRIPATSLPRIVDSTGMVGEATALDEFVSVVARMNDAARELAREVTTRSAWSPPLDRERLVAALQRVEIAARPARGLSGAIAHRTKVREMLVAIECTITRAREDASFLGVAS